MKNRSIIFWDRVLGRWLTKKGHGGKFRVNGKFFLSWPGWYFRFAYTSSSSSNQLRMRELGRWTDFHMSNLNYSNIKHIMDKERVYGWDKMPVHMFSGSKH